MEINVTHLVDEDCRQFSDSIANSGLQNIGQITWRNSCKYAENNLLVTKEEDLEDLRDWFQDFGAWSQEEISVWSTIELNALLIQFIAGDINEYQEYKDRGDLKGWKEVTSGQLYQGDDNSWYFYVGM